MTTYSELVDSVLLHLSGYTTNQDIATYLTSSVTSGALSIPLADATAVSRGTIEIGTELIWVDTVDPVALTATVPPYGRGFRGSTAASHASGVRVVSQPALPRLTVAKAVNEAITAVYPMLYGIGSTTFTFSPSINTYALPAGAQDILALSYLRLGPTLEWYPISRYRVDSNANTGVWPTGATVVLKEAPHPGATVNVTYLKPPTALVNDTDVFATVTGLPASSEDVIRLGAAQRLIPYLDTSHINGMSAEAAYAANARPQMAGIQLGKFMAQTYQLRLAEEAKRLHDLYPIRTRFSN